MNNLEQFPLNLHIKVTPEIASTNNSYISAGRCSSCPLARATNAVIPDSYYAQVGSSVMIYSRNGNGTERAVYSMPDGAMKYIGIADRHARGEKGAPAPEAAEFMLVRVR